MAARINGKQLLTFAVVGDTHVNQAENLSSSPFPCNALANARARHVFAEINRHAPAFVVHLGDMINPVPELPTYVDAVQQFKTLASELKPSMRLVPGNHDIGDKPVSWAPAGRICADYLSLYRHHFGDDYFSYDSNDLHLIVLNASVMNSGLDAEEQQKEWLVKDLQAHKGKRTFVFMHYPPYVSDPSEAGSYDNVDEPARAWLLELLRINGPEALFCGHVHNFWYDHVGDTEMYVMPATSFVRQDYSEFYRIGPGSEYGRNDEPKLGYALVHVYEQGHVVEIIRTDGKTQDPGDSSPSKSACVCRVWSKQNSIDSVGLDMRQPWAEELEITPSGGVDEFERKLARNDYPVLALWEMGIRRMRLPIQDLLNPRIRRRMQILHEAGQVFQIYSYGVPDDSSCEVLSQHAELIHALEIVIGWESADEVIPAIAALKAKCGCSIILSRSNLKEGRKHCDSEGPNPQAQPDQRISQKFNHMISHGFTLDESQVLGNYFEAHPADCIDSILFTIKRDVEPAQAIADLEGVAQRLGKRVCLYVKTTGSSPADVFNDDHKNAARFAQTVFAGVAAKSVDVILDTFADIDRGYFVRSGLVDRRYNPKVGSHVVGNILSLLNNQTWHLQNVTLTSAGATATVQLESDDGNIATLVLPDAVHEFTLVHADNASLVNPADGTISEYSQNALNDNNPWIILQQHTG